MLPLLLSSLFLFLLQEASLFVAVACMHAWPLLLFCFKQANSISVYKQENGDGTGIRIYKQHAPIITVGSRRRAHDVHAWRSRTGM